MIFSMEFESWGDGLTAISFLILKSEEVVHKRRFVHQIYVIFEFYPNLRA